MLKKIVVTPPELYPYTEPPETVGWRFVVRRSLNRDAGPWKTTYRSPIQTAVATRSEPGAFDPMSVTVHVPDVRDKPAIRYRVTLKMRWYRSNGTVAIGEDYEFDVIKWYSNGGLAGTDDYCPASLDNGS